MTQKNLGAALSGSGNARAARKAQSGGRRLREALRERTRERVPLDWAMTQMNLGTAL